MFAKLSDPIKSLTKVSTLYVRYINCSGKNIPWHVAHRFLFLVSRPCMSARVVDAVISFRILIVHPRCTVASTYCVIGQSPWFAWFGSTRLLASSCVHQVNCGLVDVPVSVASHLGSWLLGPLHVHGDLERMFARSSSTFNFYQHYHFVPSISLHILPALHLLSLFTSLFLHSRIRVEHLHRVV